MGCKVTARGQNPVCNGLTINTNHCTNYDPDGQGVGLTFSEYPQAVVRTGSYYIPARDHNFVMYDNTQQCLNRWGSTIPVSAATCGKLTKVSPCDSTCTMFYEYTPSELSFDFNYSDTWFSYLYDVSNKAGHVGIPAFYIEDETRNSTGGTLNGQPLDDNIEASSRCIPCSNFTCTAASTNLRYTCDTDYTGDPDCPHPTLFGFGTTAYKVAFKYDALSTQLPNGVTDIEVSYDGSTYTDVWDENALQGTPYVTSQNTWESGEESFEDFEIYDLNGSGATSGLRVKFRIYPQLSNTSTITGTVWEITEVLAPGSGYSVGDVFSLTYTHTHPSTTSTTFTLNLRVKAVASVSTFAGSSGFDVLRSGDTINGHTILRAFHTDDQNFQFHVLYLDGSGNNFAKDTQYTSNRAHQITTIAGYGIPDRAILIGKYEFVEKSMQFLTADIDPSAPDIYNTIRQPQITLAITNGRVTGATITDGGAGWNTLKEPPDLVVTAPLVASGKNAELEGTFTNGVLTAVEITQSGSGYDENNPPQAWIRNIYNETSRTDEIYPDDTYKPTDTNDRIVEIVNNLPKPEVTPVDVSSYATDFPDGFDALVKFGLSQSQIESILSSNESQRQQIVEAAAPAVTQQELDELKQIFDVDTEITTTTETQTADIKLDPDRRRVQQKAQELYSAPALEKLREVDRVDQYNTQFLDDSGLPDSMKQFTKDHKQFRLDTKESVISEMTQEQIPEYTNYKETFVETVQGPFINLPAASPNTKYIMTQYRPDPTSSTTIKVTLSMDPVNVGKSHFVCNTPPGTSGGTSTGSNGETITTSYTMSPLLGPGCQPWSITGDMKIWHDLGRAGQAAKDAGEAYGNPFEIT